MPLVYQQNINLHSRLGLWHIREPEAFFFNKSIFVKGIRHPHKRLQTLAGRLVLTELFSDFPLNDVRIAATRKPFLECESFHFSISHCDDYAAAIVSTKERVGVDIEVPQAKILVLKNKYLSAAEQELVESNKEDELIDFTMAWCMKEAVYKWYAEGKIDFKAHMPLQEFSGTRDGYYAKILFQKEMELSLDVQGMLLNGNCLAWVNTT